MGVAERRDREREMRRQHIVEAAERVFLERGAVNATMGDVAAAAELSKGTLYLYFASKDELYVAMSARTLEMLVEQVDAATPDAAAGTGLEALTAMMGAHQTFVRRHPERLQILLAWMASGFHADPDAGAYSEYLEMTAAIMQRAVAMVVRGQQDGSVRAELEPMHTVMQMWGGSMGMAMLYLNRNEVAQRVPTPVDFVRVQDEFSGVFLRGIAAGAEQRS